MHKVDSITSILQMPKLYFEKSLVVALGLQLGPDCFTFESPCVPLRQRSLMVGMRQNHGHPPPQVSDSVGGLAQGHVFLTSSQGMLVAGPGTTLGERLSQTSVLSLVWISESLGDLGKC